MLSSFASTDDLEAFLNRKFDTGETVQAQVMLDGATAAIRAEAFQTISLVENDTVRLAGSWEPDFELPEWPVLSVSAVALNGVPLVMHDGYEWNTRQLLRRSQLLAELTGYSAFQHAPGALLGFAGNWGGPGSTVEVTYSHGYTTIPADLVLVCLQAASRPILNPGGVQSESLGAYAVRYVNKGSGGPSVLLDDDEKKIIRTRYRH